MVWTSQTQWYNDKETSPVELCDRVGWDTISGVWMFWTSATLPEVCSLWDDQVWKRFGLAHFALKNWSTDGVTRSLNQLRRARSRCQLIRSFRTHREWDHAALGITDSCKHDVPCQLLSLRFQTLLFPLLYTYQYLSNDTNLWSVTWPSCSYQKPDLSPPRSRCSISSQSSQLSHSMRRVRGPRPSSQAARRSSARWAEGMPWAAMRKKD